MRIPDQSNMGLSSTRKIEVEQHPVEKIIQPTQSLLIELENAVVYEKTNEVVELSGQIAEMALSEDNIAVFRAALSLESLAIHGITRNLPEKVNELKAICRCCRMY